MTESNNTILQSAMRYGFPLGMFWIFRYFFFMFASTSTIMNGIYILLTPITLVLAYYATKKYKMDLDGRISFIRAWGFGIFLYFFASLLVSIPHYIYYEYIAPADFLASAFEQAKVALESLNVEPQVLMRLDEMPVPTPISMTFYDILNNTFYGIIFSIPVAAISCIGNVPPSINTNQTREQE